MMWMGQEAMGISVFDTKRKEFKGSLLGGHTGGLVGWEFNMFNWLGYPFNDDHFGMVEGYHH